MTDPRIESLIRDGKHGEAAALCEAAGDVERASELYAAVWDWESAIAVAEEAERYDLAYTHAIAGGDRSAIERLLRWLPDHPEQAAQAALAAEAKGRVVDAARLREYAADVLGAAQLYERAGELFDAARCFEGNGDYRRAGMLYERRVKEDPEDAEAALRLGGILAHFGRYEHAVRALQKAEEDPERADKALPLLIACFRALHLEDAAGACLTRLRRVRPELPVRVDDYLEQEYGDPNGLAAIAREGSEQLLAGRYRIKEPLGSGGTGRVLLAHDGFYDREVAIKVLTVGSGAQGRDAYARFAREARVAAGIEHDNVVRVFEFNPDGPFLVMEFMRGGTLADRLDERRLPLAVVRHVANATLRGLEVVHRRGVIHRDLKPANVFFGAAGDVKIGDFGVAHLQDLGATLTGALLGTLAYMAPEQITGSRKPEASTDLYAFGVMLFQMLTGDLPFPGPDFLTQHLESPIPKVGARSPELGDRFDALVEHLLRKEIEDRPGDIDVVREAIEAIDWTDPDEDAVMIAAQELPPPRESVPATAPVPEARYVTRDGTTFDLLLEREVRLLPLDARRATLYSRYATAISPFLQAVYAIDEDEARVVLEVPQGKTLADGAVLTKETRAQLAEALKRLHGAGFAHGAIDPRHVVVGPARVVLLIPDVVADGVPIEDQRQRDFAALAQL